MNKKLTKQFVVSLYADGSVKITERAVTKRGSHGQYVSAKPKVCKFKCPVCRVPLQIEI